MKKLISIICVLALLVASILAVGILPASAAVDQTRGGWTVEKSVTFDGNGNMHLGINDYATWNTPIDFSASDLDVSITFMANLTSYPFDYIFLNKEMPNGSEWDYDAWYKSCDFGARFTKEHDFDGSLRWNLQNSYKDGVGTSAYAGKDVMSDRTPLTISFKRVSATQVQMYMNGEEVYFESGSMREHLSSLGTVYLTIFTMVDTVVTDFDGNLPLAPGTPEDWTVQSGVTTDANGYVYMQEGGNDKAVYNTPIDFSAPDLDVSITFDPEFASADKFLFLTLSESVQSHEYLETAYAARLDGVVHEGEDRVRLVSYWGGTGEADLNYGGAVAPGGGAPLTFRFKRLNEDQVQMYINDRAIYQDNEEVGLYLKKLSDFKDLEPLYLTLHAQEGVTVTITGLNDREPIAPRSEEDWTLGKDVVFNEDGSLPLSHAQYATLHEEIDFTAPDLDLSFTVYLPSYHANNMVSFYLSKTLPTAAPAIGTDVYKARFQSNDELNQYGMNASWKDGNLIAAHHGNKIAYTEDATINFNIKADDQGVVRIYMNGTEALSSADYIQQTSDYIKSLGTGYISFDVESNGGGPISATITEYNGRTPVTAIEVSKDTHNWTDISLTDEKIKRAGRTTTSNIGIALDWGMSGIEFNFKGSAARVRVNYNHSNNYGNEWMAVYVNGVRTYRFMLSNGVNWYTILNNNNVDEVTNVRFVKCNAQTLVDLVDFQIDGTLEAKPEEKALTVEVIGDSISAGFGVLAGSTKEAMSLKNSDGGFVYGTLIAESLDAELYSVSRSGMGVVVNGDGTSEELMPDLYEMAQYPRNKTAMWDQNTYHPDLILVGLGTNDAVGLTKIGAEGEDKTLITEAELNTFKQGVIDYIHTLKNYHPNAKILWAYGLMNDTLMEPLREAVQEAAESYGKNEVVYVGLKDQDIYTGSTVTGSGDHPNVKCDQVVTKYLLPKAHEMLKLYVAPITGGSAGILNNLIEDKQGLRFNHTVTTTVSGADETVVVDGKTYTVIKVGSLMSTDPHAMLTLEGVTYDGVKQKYVTKARDISLKDGKITYKFSVLAQGIPQVHKDTKIYARTYLECSDGTILYGKAQATSVYAMYNHLSQSNDFDATIDAWMTEG